MLTREEYERLLWIWNTKDRTSVFEKLMAHDAAQRERSEKLRGLLREANQQVLCGASCTYFPQNAVPHDETCLHPRIDAALADEKEENR